MCDTLTSLFYLILFDWGRVTVCPKFTKFLQAFSQIYVQQSSQTLPPVVATMMAAFVS